MKTKTKRNILWLAIAAFLACSIAFAYQIKNGYELTEWLLAAMFVLIIILAPLMAWWESDLVENNGREQPSGGDYERHPINGSVCSCCHKSFEGQVYS
jgi:hypothetical protein